jgi:hypothetical protein
MSEPITPGAMRSRLTRVARAVAEPSEVEAVARLLERLAAHDDAAELRDALVVAGAAALIREVRA